MTTTNNSTSTPAAPQPGTAPRELVLTRIIDAPRELVFKAWTDPQHLAQWWGPQHFTNPVCEVDLRPGGALRIDMRGPDGSIYPLEGVFREVVVPERLVFTNNALDATGQPMIEGLTTVTFAEHEGKTLLTVHDLISQATPEAADALAGMDEGWNQSLDRLAALPALNQIGGTRVRSDPPNAPESDLPAQLAQPARRALAAAGVQRLAQLTALREAEVTQLHGIGPNALAQLRHALAAQGLSFAAEQPGKDP
jgi:uncharacterized protein YndB with AHSA1/START domain